MLWKESVYMVNNFRNENYEKSMPERNKDDLAVAETSLDHAGSMKTLPDSYHQRYLAMKRFGCSYCQIYIAKLI